MRKIIDDFDPTAVTDAYVKTWLTRVGAKIFSEAKDKAHTMELLGSLGLTDKLSRIGDHTDGSSPAWWVRRFLEVDGVRDSARDEAVRPSLAELLESGESLSQRGYRPSTAAEKKQLLQRLHEYAAWPGPHVGRIELSLSLPESALYPEIVDEVVRLTNGISFWPVVEALDRYTHWKTHPDRGLLLDTAFTQARHLQSPAMMEIFCRRLREGKSLDRFVKHVLPLEAVARHPRGPELIEAAILAGADVASVLALPWWKESLKESLKDQLMTETALAREPLRAQRMKRELVEKLRGFRSASEYVGAFTNLATSPSKVDRAALTEIAHDTASKLGLLKPDASNLRAILSLCDPEYPLFEALLIKYVDILPPEIPLERLSLPPPRERSRALNEAVARRGGARSTCESLLARLSSTR